MYHFVVMINRYEQTISAKNRIIVNLARFKMRRKEKRKNNVNEKNENRKSEWENAWLVTMRNGTYRNRPKHITLSHKATIGWGIKKRGVEKEIQYTR